jgi:hypothetical protein
MGQRNLACLNRLPLSPVRQGAACKKSNFQKNRVISESSARMNAYSKGEGSFSTPNTG